MKSGIHTSGAASMDGRRIGHTPFGMELATLAATVMAVLPPPGASAEIRVPRVISSHMVIQRGVPVAIWGWAPDGQKVAVEFRGQSVSAIAKGGRWRVVMAPMEAGGPDDMVIAGANTLVVKDVLVGEIWMAAGQSNMNWPLERSTGGGDAVAAANDGQLRFFQVTRGHACEPLEDTDVGEWRVSTPENAGVFSAVAYYFAQRLRQSLGVPVGILQAAQGGTLVESWVSRETMEGDPAFRRSLLNYDARSANHAEEYARYQEELQAWRAAAAKSGDQRPQCPAMPMGPSHPKRPAALYNARVAPLQQYPVAGVIWYQGEAGSGNPEIYRPQLAGLISSWRAGWRQPDMPFIMTQLPNFDRGGDPDNWPRQRENFLSLWQTVPRTGMAVTVDVGDDNDLHPPNKRPVGERLALMARAIAYGERIVHSGPIISQAELRSGELVLRFDHVGGGLAAKQGTLDGFEIAAEDMAFVKAVARIEDDTVVVSSPEVAAPRAARYAWHRTPPSTLYNREGLPASPFRIRLDGGEWQ